MHSGLLAFLGCHRRWFSRCRRSDGTQKRLGHGYPSTAGLGGGERLERLGTVSSASVEGVLPIVFQLDRPKSVNLNPAEVVDVHIGH